MPKSLNMTMPTSDGKWEKVELLKICSKKVSNSIIRWQRKKLLFSLSSACCCVEDCHKSRQPNLREIGEVLMVFRKKYVKPQAKDTAKRIFERLVPSPAIQKFNDFLDGFNKLAKNVFEVAA